MIKKVVGLEPAQTTCESSIPGVVITGYTVNVAVMVLWQPFGAVARIVKVVTWFTAVALVTVALIFPEPLAGIPPIFAVLSLVQSKVVPAKPLVVLKTMFATDPVQTLCDAGVATAKGVGLTTISTVVGGLEGQLAADALIVKVVVWSTLVMLVNVPVMVAEVPLAAIPVRFAVLFLVQLKVVPATPLGFVIVIGAIAMPPHNVCVAGAAATVGLGLTITVTVVVLVPQPAELAVIVKVVVC